MSGMNLIWTPLCASRVRWSGLATHKMHNLQLAPVQKTNLGHVPSKAFAACWAQLEAATNKVVRQLPPKACIGPHDLVGCLGSEHHGAPLNLTTFKKKFSLWETSELRGPSSLSKWPSPPSGSPSFHLRQSRPPAELVSAGSPYMARGVVVRPEHQWLYLRSCVSAHANGISSWKKSEANFRNTRVVQLPENSCCLTWCLWILHCDFSSKALWL